MKNLTIKTAMLLFICLLSVNTVMAKSKNLKYDSLSCLRIDGIISNANEGLDGECTIETIHSDGVIDTLMLKEGKKKFGLVLEKNSYYAIRISKKGYISKIIAINTEIVTELDGVQIFEFEASLIKESAKNKLNRAYLTSR